MARLLEQPSPMTITPVLSGSLLRTYHTIFQHPISHNLEWRHVHALLHHLCKVDEEQANGNVKVSRNGQSLVLHPPSTKDVATTDEVLALRHFIEKSEPTLPDPNESTKRWLLVIDHREARLYHSEVHGAVPQLILPHEPDDFFRHAQDSVSFTRGKEKPDPNSFFTPIAEALQSAGPILIFGNGTGTSSELEQFAAWTKLHHPALASRIVASMTINESHLTTDQLLAMARNFFSTQVPSPV